MGGVSCAKKDETSTVESLQALARLDWDAARPVVETLASAGNFPMTAIALSLLYERAQAAGDSAQIEKYRALLKAIVGATQAPHVSRQIAPLQPDSLSLRPEAEYDGKVGAFHVSRQLALSNLVKTEWNGQEDWIISLLADPALSKGVERFESYVETFNILSPLAYKNSERWIPFISNLVGHNQRAVHESAVKCLTEYLNRESADKKLKKEIAQRLAPWLTDPNWAAADDLSGFIKSLADIQAPELLSGLIWVLEHDENQDNRATAAAALTQYRDRRAIPALRLALEKEEREDRREKIVTALAECGGFSDDEMVAAVEAYAKMDVTEAGAEEINRAKYPALEKPLPLNVSIGRILIGSKTIQATEGFAAGLIERAKALRASQPAVARRILRGIEGVPLPVVEIDLVERIGAGLADLDAIKLALQNRDSIQKSAGDELYKLIKQGGYAAGIAAAVLNDEREHRETLKGTDAKAQLAMLACARYLRDKLPVELVARLLKSKNREMSKVAEMYLEVEDSAEARKQVLARRRGEAYVLGDDAGVGHLRPGYWEDAMRKEIKSRNDLEAIYGLAQADFSDIRGVIIRVRGGKAEISLYEVEGRRDVRALTESEFEELRDFTSRQEVEDLGPEGYSCLGGHEGCYSYLRLTKDGGRRIMLYALRRAPKNPTPHEELSGLFYRLSKSGEFVTRYEIEDKIPGVEVLLADKKQEAVTACGAGREIRVLIGEKGAEYKRDFDEATPEWREFSSGAPGKVTDDPPTCRLLSAIPMLLKMRWNSYYSSFNQPTSVGNAWVYSSPGEDAGIWKFEPGAEPVKIISGSYTYPVATPDGKWLAAIKEVNEGGENTSQLVRHNLKTGKEFTVTMPNGDHHQPVQYVAAHGKILLGAGGHYPGEINYLLDPETGSVLEVKGEFRPLDVEFARELQPTGNPNEFWAAIRDSQKSVTNIGRYDSKNFAFTSLIELPGLTLSNSDFWVDAAGGKIWLTYSGHLLRIPLPAKSK
ncbi:MAG TPA: HEAT repeat domain-containing protein [Blastocatellia bacterium]|nr:HEAT repeat domain-containing protein [Blastocatellia bacterium]